jgi:hypothetical protein
MKNQTQNILLLIVLLTATVFQFLGLIRYNSRLPDDLLRHLLYIISIICLLAGLATALIRNKKMKI